MIVLDTETTRKLAKLSGLRLSEEQLATFTHELEAVIEYAAQLESVAASLSHEPTPSLINVVRDDHAQISGNEQLFASAPCTRDGFFVMPKIVN